MKSLPKKCAVDSNVPLMANRATNPMDTPGDLICCVMACVEAIEHVVKKVVWFSIQAIKFSRNTAISFP